MFDLVPRLAHQPWQELAAGLFGGSGSYGNGAAMRVAPLGAFFAHDLDQCVIQAERSAIVTHAHTEAIAGAIAVAVAAGIAACASGTAAPPLDAFLGAVVERTPRSEVRDRLESIRGRPIRSASVAAKAVGNGSLVSAVDTVPFALWCAGRFLSDYEQAVWRAISTGGDMDTLAAIVGGVAASYTGLNGIPSRWLAAREPLPPGLGAIDQPA
jgi:ADP-ribosylglycohydrolase